jgi:hypothetical protein
MFAGATAIVQEIDSSLGYFFAAVFFCTAACVLAASALFAAQRFFKAATIAALPAALSFRLGFDTSGGAETDRFDSPLILAHLAFCPSAIRRRAAAETLRFRGTASALTAVLAGPPDAGLENLLIALLALPVGPEYLCQNSYS